MFLYESNSLNNASKSNIVFKMNCKKYKKLIYSTKSVD